MIVNLTYGPGLRLVNAFRDVSTPLFLANIQPEPRVTKSWDMADLTYNQGVHGAQDTANSLIHVGKQFSVWSGDWKDAEFVKAFEVFASAAHAVAVMKQTKVAVFGRMPGMGDILTDPHTFMRVLGPQVDHIGMGPGGRRDGQGQHPGNSGRPRLLQGQLRHGSEADPAAA